MFLAQTGLAQTDLLDQLSRKAPNCENISFNAAELITRLYGAAKFDSIALVAREWEFSCGLSEPLFRLNVLLAIEQGTFSGEMFLDEPVLALIDNYETRVAASKEKNYRQVYEYYKIFFGYVPINSDFDIMTSLWADALIVNDQLVPAEKVWCLVYANKADSAFEMLKGNELQGSIIQETYNAEVQRAKRMVDGNLGFIAGIALPSGSLADVVGVKSLWGFQLGAKYRKMQYDLTLAFRPGKPRQEYEVMHQGDLVNTNHYFGGYIGADLAYELRRSRKTEFNLLGGVAFDGFDAIEGNTKEGVKGKSINSLNLNAGLGYRLYTSEKGYLGLQVKYNLVGYNNKSGTSLDGNYISAVLSYNIFGNIQKSALLKRLRHDKQ